jgi:hypothetical protein
MPLPELTWPEGEGKKAAATCARIRWNSDELGCAYGGVVVGEVDRGEEGEEGRESMLVTRRTVEKKPARGVG